MEENIPINNFRILQVPNKLWENIIEIIIEFKQKTNTKNIKHALNLLENFSKNWPKHEKPKKWIVKREKENIKKMQFTNRIRALAPKMRDPKMT